MKKSKKTQKSHQKKLLCPKVGLRPAHQPQKYRSRELSEGFFRAQSSFRCFMLDIMLEKKS